MYEQLLEQAGLTRNETLAYLALLKIGKSRSGAVVKEARISGGKVYETLYKLVDKGLVKIAEENGVKQFEASDPEMLISYLEERKRTLTEQEHALTDAIPHIRTLHASAKKEEGVALVHGMRGAAALVNAALEHGKSIAIMGARSSKETSFNAFWQRWHLRRGELKKPARILFTDNGSAYEKNLGAVAHTTIRHLTAISPAATMIIDDDVFIFTYEEELHTIHIHSAATARSYRGFFESLWEHAA